MTVTTRFTENDEGDLTGRLNGRDSNEVDASCQRRDEYAMMKQLKVMVAYTGW